MDILIVYRELLKLPTFSLVEVEQLTGSKNSAYFKLSRLIKAGAVKKIRSNLYSAVNYLTNQVIANKYQIACAASETAYISYHTAFEYHGVAKQAHQEVYISSDTKIRHFEFEGLKFRYIPSRIRAGVITSKDSDGVQVTDLERTLVDGIKELDKAGGLKEIINYISNIKDLDEGKLKTYLDHYKIQTLYQRVGFLLSQYHKPSHEFVSYCKSKIGSNTGYLSNDSGVYDREWKLVVPAKI